MNDVPPSGGTRGQRPLDDRLDQAHYPTMVEAPIPNPKTLSDRELLDAYNALDEEPEHPLSRALCDEIEKRGLDL